MEHLPGGTLYPIKQHYHSHSYYDTLFEWTQQTVSALVYLHERGIIHRDVKLGNLMLDGEGKIKLIDFGVSTWKWMLPFENKSLIGSPPYMAPEIIC